MTTHPDVPVARPSFPQLQIHPEPAPCAARWRDPRVWMVLMVVTGIALRLAAYLANRSLWLDEAMLAVSFHERTLAELLAPPLPFRQHGPAGFLIVEHLVAHAAGMTELALRAVPMLAAILSIPLFAALARRMLAPWPATFAVGLVAINSALVFYGSQVKPYSTDVLVATAILLTAHRLPPDAPWPRTVRLGLSWGLAALVSSPSAFVVAGVALVRWSRQTILLLAAWSLSGLAALLHARRYADGNDTLQGFWAQGFPAGDPIRWFLTLPARVVEHPLLWDRPAAGLVAGMILLVVGGVTARRSLRLALAPVLVTVGAAVLHLYPFGGAETGPGRVILFLVPCFALLVAQGAAVLPRWAGVGCVLAVSVSAVQSVIVDRHRYSRSDVPSVLEQLGARGVTPAELTVYYTANAEYRAYRGQDGAAVVPSHWFDTGGPAEMAGVPLPRWILFSFLYRPNRLGERSEALAVLQQRGVVRDSVVADGSAAYLVVPPEAQAGSPDAAGER